MKHSFTLVEILVAMAAGAMVLVALYSIYTVNVKTYRRSINQQELAQNARISMERISRDIRQTDRVITSLPLTSSDPLNPPPSSIQFQDGHETTKIQYLKYYLTDHNLNRQVLHYAFSADPNEWVAWNAQDEFGHLPTEYIDQDAIKADKISVLKFYGEKVINIELQVTDETNTFDFRTKVWGRNIQ